MTNPTHDHRNDPTELRELRHLAVNGGWVTAGYFDGHSERHQPRDVLLAAGHIEPGQRGRIHTYEVTAAGRAHLAAQAS